MGRAPKGLTTAITQMRERLDALKVRYRESIASDPELEDGIENAIGGLIQTEEYIARRNAA